AAACLAWKVPSRPVSPCTSRRVFLSINTAIFSQFLAGPHPSHRVGAPPRRVPLRPAGFAAAEGPAGTRRHLAEGCPAEAPRREGGRRLARAAGATCVPARRPSARRRSL